ncbi:MAG: Ankyrin [Verrucomicrobiales bacterium]|nr:Ankyrin [Verrucomicrobiales bacterium]
MLHPSPKLLENLEAGTKTSSTLPPDQRALLDAARTGDVDKVRELLAKGVPVDVREDYAGGDYYQQSEQTPLMYGAAGGHIAIVQLLLKAGANVNAIDKMFSREYGGEQTALHYAGSQPNVAVVEELLNAGADPNALTKNIQNRGDTPLNYAIRKGHRDIAQLLIKRGTHLGSKIGRKRAVSPLWVVVQSRRDIPATTRDLFLLLLEAGADPNGEGDANQTAAFGLAANDVDDPKNLPVEIANELLEKLLKAGAKPDWLDKFEGTPLENALIRTNPPAIKLLLQAGADVNRIFKRGTALDICKYDSTNCERDLKNLMAMPLPDDEKRANTIKQARAKFENKLRRCNEIAEILKKSGAKLKSELPQAG